MYDEQVGRKNTNRNAPDTPASKLLELEKHLKMERVLTRIATLLATNCEVDAAIDACLADMGRLMDVDRAYVFRIHDDDALMDNTWNSGRKRPRAGVGSPGPTRRC